MPRLPLPPTKSSLLALRRQLAFAEEGYDLLEQKRQILIVELMSRLGQARNLENRAAAALDLASAALRAAILEIGSPAVDRAALGVRLNHEVTLDHQHLMGLRIPHVTARTETASVQFGVGGTSAHLDDAMRGFVALLPLLAQLAELENAVLRLAGELRKTQRRCNALSKLFIPSYRDTIGYIVGALEERERESFVILKLIRDRLAETS